MLIADLLVGQDSGFSLCLDNFWLSEAMVRMKDVCSCCKQDGDEENQSAARACYPDGNLIRRSIFGVGTSPFAYQMKEALDLTIHSPCLAECLPIVL